jgi:type II secretory pathway pseudopilin PulG
MLMAKGVSQIATAAIYVGITVSAISVALSAGVPALQNMQDSSSISQMQQFMQQLDGLVQQVASEGEGSTRTISTTVNRGSMLFDESSNSPIY